METPEASSAEEYERITKTKKRRHKTAVRFSDEQIKSLEAIFEMENKIESKKKLQIARDLGLQPRQVAIWFQNRRARWKSKQIEQDYKMLKAKYDKLYVQVDELNKEKHSLQIKLNELRDRIKNLDNENLSDREAEFRPSPMSSKTDHQESLCAEDKERITKCMEKTEEEQLLCWDEEDEISNQLAVPSGWCNISSASISLFRQSSGSSDWWENV